MYKDHLYLSVDNLMDYQVIQIIMLRWKSVDIITILNENLEVIENSFCSVGIIFKF